MAHAGELHRVHGCPRLPAAGAVQCRSARTGAYQLLSNASTTHYEVAYLAMFAVPLVGRAQLRRQLPLWLKLTSVAGAISTLFSLLISAYPFVDVADKHAYAIKIVGTVLVSNCVALAFYWARTRFLTRRQIADQETSSAD
jgi:hypothetical protein